MRALFLDILFLLLAGCSSMPSYETGDISIRTVQSGERTLKLMLYDAQNNRIDQASIRMTNPRDGLIKELELKKRITSFQYPMHESSVFIEATDTDGNAGTRQFFRSQLREIREMKY